MQSVLRKGYITTKIQKASEEFWRWSTKIYFHSPFNFSNCIAELFVFMVYKLEIGEEACALRCETIRSLGNCVGGQNKLWKRTVRPCASSFRKASTEMIHQNCFTHFFEWRGKCVKVHLVARTTNKVSFKQIKIKTPIYCCLTT